MPKILAQGLLSLREKLVMPSLVNSSYSAQAATKGQTIEIPTGSAVTGYNITPSNTPVAPGDSTMATTDLVLDTWKGANFHMTDKQLGEIDVNAAFLPIQTSGAMRTIANFVNTSLAGLYTGVYGYSGTAGTTPFASDATAATAVRKVLQNQLCPIDDQLAFVINPDAEEKALNLSAFSQAQNIASPDVIIDGRLGRKYGFNFAATTTVATHTSTALTAGAATVNGVNAAGATTVSIAKATNTSPLVVGDILSFAGISGTYVVTAAVTLAVGNTNVSISPGLASATVGGEAVTLRATHVANLAFHKEAFGLAIRPTAATDLSGQDRKVLTMQDPQSGLAITLEVTRQYHQWMWEFSVLYGCKTIRPEYACRLAG